MTDLLVETQNEIPVVQFRWLLPVGGATDSRSQEGLTHFAAELFKRGGKKRDRYQTAHYLAQTSGHLNMHVTLEHTQLAATVPSRQLLPFVQRLVDVFNDASPHASEVEKLRQELLESFEVGLENAQTKASLLWRRLLYGDDAYGNFVMGSVPTLKSLVCEDLNEKRNRVTSTPGILALGGDVTSQSASQIKELLDPLSMETEVNFQKRVPFEPTLGNRLALWHDSNQKQSTVMLGWTMPAWTQKEFILGRMVEKIFCSEYSSWLCQDFRQRAGLTYGIYGAYQPSLRGMVYRLHYSTATNFGPQFLRDLMGALKAFSQGEGTYQLTDQDGQVVERQVQITQDDFEQCRRKMLNSLPFWFHTCEKRLARTLEARLYGAPENSFQKYQNLIDSVQYDDLIDFARRMFSVSGMAVSVVDDMTDNAKAYHQLCEWTDFYEEGAQLCGLK